MYWTKDVGDGITSREEKRKRRPQRRSVDGVTSHDMEIAGVSVEEAADTVRRRQFYTLG